MRVEHVQILDALPKLNVELQPSVSLTELTSLGIGGTTDLLRIHRHESIPDLLNLLDQHEVPRKFLGGGSNLLVLDGELPFVVLQLAQPRPDIVIEGNIASVDAAADFGRTVTFCAKNDLGGLEGLIGVPGTVGGALRMNAGAYDTNRIVRKGSAGLPSGHSDDRNPSRDGQISFEYRHTSFAPDDMMLAVKLHLPSSCTSKFSKVFVSAMKSGAPASL